MIGLSGPAKGTGRSLGPLGGIGSGPKVEAMLEAMDSWSGLCLHYRYNITINGTQHYL